MFSHINLQQVKGVLLDLDNTLYAYEPCHMQALEACLKQLQADTGLDETRCKTLYNQSRKQVNDTLKGQAASHSRLLYFQKLWETVDMKTNYAKTLAYDTLYWDTFLDVMRLYPGAKHFLDTCAKKQIPIAIVTDLTTHIQHRKILRLGIETDITFMVSSEEAGIEKPGQAPFLLALQKLKLTAADVIMVGDNPATDRAGAEKLGIPWHHPDPAFNV